MSLLKINQGLKHEQEILLKWSFEVTKLIYRLKEKVTLHSGLDLENIIVPKVKEKTSWISDSNGKNKSVSGHVELFSVMRNGSHGYMAWGVREYVDCSPGMHDHH